MTFYSLLYRKCKLYLCCSAIFGKFSVISVASIGSFMTSEQQLFQTDFFATIINCHNYFFKQNYSVVFILRKICMNVYKKTQLLPFLHI